MRTGAALALSLILSLPLAAHAAPRATAASFGESFLDKDNNGVWSNGDILLSDLVKDQPADVWYFNFESKFGPYTPPSSGRPVGLVFRGNVVFPSVASGVYYFVVNGNVFVEGSIKLPGAASALNVNTTAGNITFAPQTRINVSELVKKGRTTYKNNGNGQFGFTAGQGTLSVGEGSRFFTKSSGGAYTSFDLSARTLEVGQNVSMAVGGGDYNSYKLSARAVTVGENFSFTGPSHGKFSLISFADVFLSRFNVKAGYISIGSYSDAESPQAKRVHISDSSIQQTYKNGDLRILSYADIRDSRYAPDAFVLERTRVSSRAKPLYVPDPIIRR